MMFGEHASFIIPSYIISFAAITGMALFVITQYKARKSELKRLEEAGIKRRSRND
jgi:heme exporter protein CcmD